MRGLLHDNGYMNRRIVTVLVSYLPLAASLLSSMGCVAQSGGVSLSNFSVRPVLWTDTTAILDAAEAALVEHGYSIARRDGRAATITTVPIEIQPEADERVLRARQQARMRKVAEVRVQTLGTETRVLCRVAIQEQSTEAHRLLAYERASSDVPHDTPIDRGAYATAEQSTVWQLVRRDGAAERAILVSITQRTGTASPGGE